ncbi:MAG: GNAT family N-acetyltransferase [Calditrichaceae bacterium]|nr:GNAT family N-acetyltransferase [Calditrichaceae bacterium]
MNLSKIQIRELNQDESVFLKEMTYQSVFVLKNEPPAPKDIINLPELCKYYKNWGRSGDHCLIAEYKGEKIGAVWCRLYNENNKGFVYVSEDIPELSIAVDKSYRNKGVGTLLLGAFYKYLNGSGFNSISLSVDKRNPAVNLYQRTGFKIIRTNENDHIMLKEL